MSARVDLELNCEACGDAFVFSRGEQDFYDKRGLRAPKRCPACREAQRLPSPPPEPEPPQAGHEVVCSACGALTRLSFEPTTDRPVYCPACFRNR